MNIIKRLFTYMIAALALAACSDDEKYTVEPVGDDGTITFTISIPEQEKVVSRAGEDTADDSADERKIKDLSVLIYDNSGDLLQSEIGITHFTSGPTGENSLTRITVALSDKAKGFSGDATVYIIANAGHLLTADNTATVTALKAVTTDAELPSAKGFLMTGKVESSLNSASLLTSTIILTRTEAKLTIENDATTTFRLESASLYNAATKGYVTAGADNSYATDYSDNPDNFDNFKIYTYPRRNDNPDNSDNSTTDNSTTDNSDNPFIIVGGKYAGNDAYYRLDLYKGKEALDINPNHWYEIHISSVTGPGYPSAEEAARHPAGNMAVTIHDHAPEVLDIAFDGTRELGVTDVITYSANGEGTAILTVKYYSKDAADMATAPVLTTTDDWLTIGEPVIDTAGDGTTTPGRIAQYPLTFKATDQLGSLDALIKTTWQGLSRTTQVNWTRAFDGNAISTAVLTIHPTDGTGDKVISKYWTFLSGIGDAPDDAGEAPILYGIQPEKMGGKVRSEGFHFPVMYGERGKTNEERWHYSYKVTMTNIENAKYDCSWQIIGDDAVKSVVFTEIKNETYYTFTLTRPGNTSGNDGSDPKNGNDYTYGTGKLILTVEPKGSKEAVRVASRYEFDLYHTGFFHYDTGNHRTGNHDTGYYYYEVLPVDGATARTRYILDRNLGAKAAGMYIQTLEGTSHVPANEGWPFSCGDESAGGYYKVAYDAGTSDYGDPVMYTDVCPPGYRVPKQKIWDAIRNSKKFISRQSTAGATSYFTAYYETAVTDNGSPVTERIYFPKSRFLDGNSQSGDANSGYYWTQTAAVGTEKDEIGRWLKSLQLSGAATSYINGRVDDSNGQGQHYAMSVRCINTVDDPETYNVTSFNVKGATHVFLYKGNVSDKEYTTSWPGHAIGNYSTVNDVFFNFVYESTVYKPEDLKVIFNYVDESGKIWTISQNGNVALSKAEGWAVSELVNKNVTCIRGDDPTITITD